ncbi:hypothetical protein [Mesorhizobium sp. RMAD-H1]|uniref:hypothetical protein n=1 Tax=Mesorhizobium sp. RMAD-H1 TaxID=2587065 RepID=UPI0016087E58|nr:hypothetical protein [Mesorhizobium sp. RMAD-H1]MBB2974391.1 anti-sigma factor ChrR (cupin superfamily) [Mesorhizobium sp. RMAD-H1]
MTQLGKPRESFMPAYQVRIAYLTHYRKTRHYFHSLIIAGDRSLALDEGRAQLAKRSPNARIVHESAILRPDSLDIEVAVASGWMLKGGWWSRPIRAEDDLAVIALHGHADGNQVNVRTPADCLAIDRA